MAVHLFDLAIVAVLETLKFLVEVLGDGDFGFLNLMGHMVAIETFAIIYMAIYSKYTLSNYKANSTFPELYCLHSKSSLNI